MLLFSISFLTFGALLTSAQSLLWHQCGGIGFTGPTTCVTGAECDYVTPYYSCCFPPGYYTPIPTATTLTA
ncbi:hypothetical protein C8J56DRAFT_1059835 [Mycena floridula]|nr:hypothetical protein C8J56DRAFT_1059835 [Mycena floridula]